MAPVPIGRCGAEGALEWTATSYLDEDLLTGIGYVELICRYWEIVELLDQRTRATVEQFAVISSGAHQCTGHALRRWRGKRREQLWKGDLSLADHNRVYGGAALEGGTSNRRSMRSTENDCRAGRDSLHLIGDLDEVVIGIALGHEADNVR